MKNKIIYKDIDEAEYDCHLMESVVFKENSDLVDLVNKDPGKVHIEATSYKSQRSYPMIVFQMFLAIREHIHKNYPNLLTTQGNKWVQFACNTI